MSAGKHTPGPWLIVVEDEEGQRWTEDDVGEHSIDEDIVVGIGMASYLKNPGNYFSPHFWESNHEIVPDEKGAAEHMANARLMRAAPDMEHALDDVILACSYALEENTEADRGAVLRMILAKALPALKKARGES